MADREGITIYMQGLFAEKTFSAMQNNQMNGQLPQHENISGAVGDSLLAGSEPHQNQHVTAASNDLSKPEEMTREMKMAAVCRQISMVGFEPISGVFDRGVKW